MQRRLHCLLFNLLIPQIASIHCASFLNSWFCPGLSWLELTGDESVILELVVENGLLKLHSLGETDDHSFNSKDMSLFLLMTLDG